MMSIQRQGKTPSGTRFKAPQLVECACGQLLAPGQSPTDFLRECCLVTLERAQLRRAN